MIKSMTGYGGANGGCEDYELSVELKSVNNRFADISVRTPRGFMFAEDPVKSAVQAHISRGKIDVFVSLTSLVQNGTTVNANKALAAEYKAAIDSIAAELRLSGEATAYQISKFPDVLTLDKKELDKEETLEIILSVVERALAEHDLMRLNEGSKLYRDITTRLDAIEAYVDQVEQRSPKTVQDYRERLTNKMLEVLGNSQIDDSRILAEAAIYSDRIAVDEETVRLRSHMAQMREILSSNIPVGRKLDFIVQELNREANTIGSKCNDSEVTRIVLEIKSEIEKIREQVQNIE